MRRTISRVLSWAHTFTNNAVLTSSLLYHFDRADYDGGAGDYPTITTYHHSSQYEGAEEQLKWDVSRNHLDVGVFGFAQQDQADFNLAFTDNSSPTLSGVGEPHRRAHHRLAAGYLRSHALAQPVGGRAPVALPEAVSPRTRPTRGSARPSCCRGWTGC